MLQSLSGRVNYAVTGVTIIDLYQNKTITLNEVTEVYFDELTEEEIEWYIENEKYIYERCGYSIAGKSAIYISKINGLSCEPFPSVILVSGFTQQTSPHIQSLTFISTTFLSF